MKTELEAIAQTAELLGILWRPKLRYYAELTRPSSMFMSEWNVMWVVIDSTSKDDDGNPTHIALCVNRETAQIITDALNYGVRVIALADKSE